jgi:hypothetical protein
VIPAKVQLRVVARASSLRVSLKQGTIQAGKMPAPLLCRGFDRNDALEKRTGCGQCCVGQASRLSPYLEIETPVSELIWIRQRPLKRKSFKVRDRRDACSTAWLWLSSLKMPIAGWQVCPCLTKVHCGQEINSPPI